MSLWLRVMNLGECPAKLPLTSSATCLAPSIRPAWRLTLPPQSLALADLWQNPPPQGGHVHSSLHTSSGALLSPIRWRPASSWRDVPPSFSTEHRLLLIQGCRGLSLPSRRTLPLPLSAECLSPRPSVTASE